MMGPRVGLLGLLIVVMYAATPSKAQGGIGSSPVDLVFLVDTSQWNNGTAGLEEEIQIKSFFTSFLESAEINSGAVRVAMVTFSTHPKTIFKLDSFKSKLQVQAAVFDAEFIAGERNTADALSVVRGTILTARAGDRPGVPNVILMFTTGKSDRNNARTLQESEALKYARTNIFVLGYGLTADALTEVQEMASIPTSENYFELNSINDLDLVREIVFAQLFTRAEQAYNSPATGSEQLDVGFLVHVSSSMKRKEFNQMVSFMKGILDFAGLDDDMVRVGAAVYRRRGTLLFDFNQYSTRDDITAAIESLSFNYRAKSTGTASGLNVIRNELFNANAGDRPDAPNLLIVITDSNADTDVAQTIKASEQLKATGAAVFTIGLNITTQSELNGIATSPDFTLFVNDTKYLQDQDFLLQERFVALRSKEVIPFIIPEEETLPPPTVASTEVVTTEATNVQELDVVLALHASNKVKSKDISKRLIPFVKDIVAASDIDSGAVRFSIVTFGSDAKVKLNLKAGAKSKKVTKAIKRLKTTFKTPAANVDIANLLKTIQTKVFVKKAGDRTDVSNLIVVITDTPFGSESTANIQYAEALRKEDTSIFAIGVGDALSVDMESIASEPKEYFTYTGKSYNDFTDSLTLRQRLAQQIRIFDNLNVPNGAIKPKPKPTRPPKKQGKTTDKTIIETTKQPNVVEVTESSTKKANVIPETIPVLTTTTPAKTLVTAPVLSFTSSSSVTPAPRLFPPLSASEKADIVFALHLSPSASPFDFASVQNFLQQIVSGVDVESGRVSLGLLFYAADPEVIFHINQYNSVEDMERSIQGLDNMKRNYRTDASGALDLGRQMLSSYFGGREDVPRAMVFITDAASTTNVDLIELKQETAIADGIDIYAIGINLPDKSELESLATSPDNVMTVMRYGELFSNIDYLKQKILALRSGADDVTERIAVTPDRDPKGTDPAGPTMTLAPFTETPPIRIDLPGSKTKRKHFEHYLMKDEPGLSPLGNERRTLSNGETGNAAIGPSNLSTQSWCGNTSYDLVIILDSSTSVQIDNWNVMIDATKSFLSRLDIDNGYFRVGLISYSSTSTIQFHLNTYNRMADILNAFANLPYTYGRTNTAAAMFDLRTKMFTPRNGDRPGVPNIAVIVTDGESNINVERTIPEADLAREAGITVFAIGIGLDTESTELDAIAGVRANRFFVDGFDQLKDKMETLYNFVCPAFDFSNVPIIPCNQRKLDIIFLLDSSSSMGRNSFKTMVNATKAFIESEDIDTGNTRIGVLTYSTDIEVHFHLNDFDNVKDVLNALDNIKFNAGSTNIAGALHTMRTVMLTEEHGARPDSSKVGIVITDGVSNINFENVLPESNRARSEGIVMLAIGVGLMTTREIDAIAGRPENRINIDDFDELELRLDLLFRSVCRNTIALPEIPELSCAEIDLDLIFVLDSSTSISNDEFKKMLNITNTFIQSTDIDNGRIRIGVVLYSTDVIIQFHLNRYTNKADMMNAVWNIRHMRGDTNIADAFRVVRNEMFTRKNGDRDGTPNIIIVITDGVPNLNVDRTIPESDLIKAGIARIFVVGVRVEDAGVLDEIASQPTEENRLSINEFDELRLDMDKLYIPICTPYVAPVIPGKVCKLGDLDLVIILDASTSVTAINFKKMLNFTKSLLSGADIDSGAVRVGVLVYSTKVKVEFNLNTYNRKADVMNAIDSIRYIYGSTNTADAIKTMTNEMFTRGKGDRANVDNTGIVITDGISNINSRQTLPNAKKAHKSIHVYAIGIGLTERRELDGIATPPATKNSFLVSKFEELEGLEKKVFAQQCTGLISWGNGGDETTEDEVGDTVENIDKHEVNGDFDKSTEIIIENGHLDNVNTDVIEPLTNAPVVKATRPPRLPSGKCGLTSVDLILVLDASTSVTEANFQKVRDFCKDLVDRADINSGSVRVGAVIYSTEVKIQFHLNQFSRKADIEEAIDNIPYIFGSTNTADALRTVHSEMFSGINGDRPGVDDVVVVVTDGLSNVNGRRTLPEAEFARSRNIHIYAVGIGLTDTRELDGIASRPIADNRFAVQNFEELSVLATTMFGTAEECGSSVTEAPKVITTTAPPVVVPSGCGLSKVDVVLILDASTSVRQANFDLMLQFCKDIVGKADVDSKSVRIGALIYSTGVKIQFHLDEFDTKDALIAAIDKIPYIYGSTNSADALKTMHQEMFVAGRGDRPDADNIAFMITDGVSNINSRRTIPEAEAAMAKGIKIYAIGIGLKDTRELKGMATKPIDEHMFNVKSFKELDGLVDTIFGGAGACEPDNPPIANAGNDVTIQRPLDTVTLSGVASTDDKEVVIYSWRLTSGPSNFKMDGEDDVQLRLRDLKPGRYTFTLTVFDALGQSSDDTVDVIVEEQDMPPVADAGEDVYIQLPSDFITLNGDRSTDDKKVVSYDWVQISGDDDIGTFPTGPSLDIFGAKPGVYEFKLTVFDELGQQSEDTVAVFVEEADQPPVANAGADMDIQLPTDRVTLSGRRSTDDVAVVSYRWSVVSGNARLSAGNTDDSVDVSGLREGVYVFGLEVEDELGQTDTDTVQVTVRAADIPPIANAGNDVTIQLPANSVVLDGSASSDDVAIVKYKWITDPADRNRFTAQGGDTATLLVTDLEEGVYTFALNVTDGVGLSDRDNVVVTVEAADIPPKSNAGADVTVQLPDNAVTLDGSASSDDVAIVTYEWMVDPSETKSYIMQGVDSPVLQVTDLEEGVYKFALKVTDGAGLTDIDNTIVTVAAADIPPKSNAGADLTVQLPENFVVLDGSASSDDVAIVTYEWMVDPSETKTYTMEGADTLVLEVFDLEEGVYKFALKVTDGAGLTDIDTAIITVSAADIPPKSNAGADVTVQLPDNAVTLDGRASSDDVAIVTYEWMVDPSETKSYILQNVDSPVLQVSDLEEGVYKFALKVTDDAGLTDIDNVIVTVAAADIPPKSNAGADVTVQLPDNAVTLDGSASSDDVAIVTYEWMVDPSEKKPYTMQGGDSPVLQVSDLEEGVYKFALKVTDDAGLSDVDETIVTVQAADNPPIADAGEDVHITSLDGGDVILDGSRSSDDVRIVRYRWRLREGDRKVGMAGDRSDALTLSNLKEGLYKFTLTVVDEAGQRDTDEVTVSVRLDNPPVADAGRNYTLPASVSSITLMGNGSSDDYGIVSYQWTQIDGEPVSGLSGTDGPFLGVDGLKPGSYKFQLRVEDGKGQSSTDTAVVIIEKPDEPVCGLEKTDLVFVVDASTSVTQINFQKQLDFMKSVVEYADIDSGSVRVGALTYSTKVETQFYLNSYSTKAEVLEAIDDIKYTYGSTNTADGLRIMRDELFTFRNGDREDVPNKCIVITDGVSNINSRDTLPQAELSRDIGIHIYAVGVGLTDTRELDGIASKPISENRFAVKGFEELEGLEKIIFSTICGKTTPAPTTTTAPPTTTTTPMPVTPEGPVCGLSKTDVVIILDASTSVTDVNFQKMRNFVKEFISNTDVDSGSVRFGLNIYSTTVRVMWQLNSYSTQAEYQEAIDNIPYPYGSTNTADALKTMHRQMFTPANGDRPDAPNVCIILTDGVSNINSRRTIPDAEAARKDNITIYAVGIALKDTREVDAIASVPSTSYRFNVQSFDELKGLEQRIFSSVDCDKPKPTEPPKDYPPVANAGDDQYLQLPEDTITLSGLKSTDDVEVVSYTWTLLDGSPDVNVRDTNSPELELYGLKEGTYRIELTVKDKLGQTDTDEVAIYVLAEPDLPPNANAGSDIQIQLPKDTVKLNGKKSTDDKRVTGYNWSRVSGPSSVRITGDRRSNPTISNLVEGEYVFRLVVNDEKGQTDDDTVTVVVKPARDLPPKADAGRNFTIQLPDDSVTLDGCRSSDDIGIVRYEWVLVSGNGRRVRMRGDDTCSLSLSRLDEGAYTYKLTVYDKSGQSSSDYANINVTPAPRVSGYDVIFVLDSSVTPDMFRWMNDYARNIIREMSIDDGEFRVGYLIYSTGAYRQFNLNSYDTKQGVYNGIDKVGYRPGGKNTAAALKYVRNQMFTARNGDRDYAENYVILLTGDGASRDPFDAATEACRLQADGVGMFSVGLGDITDRTELHAYSSLPRDDYELVIEDESQMGELPGLMLYNLQNGSPRKSECPRAPVTTPRPYVPGACHATGDILFILDSSGSVGQENFYKVLNFTYATIEGLSVDDGSFRVSVMTFSDTSRLEFNLNEYTTKEDLKEGIRQVRYTYGNTHTAHALRRARTEVFSIPGGDRPDVPNAIVIITDGQSNVNHELTIPEARSLKADGVTILTVAVGFTSETSELSGLTSPPVHDNLIYVEDYTGLASLKDKLIEPLCRKSDKCRSSPCQNGGVCMDGIQSFVCLCPDDYFGDTCSKQCGEPADVVIVLDSSNTVGEYNFGRLKEYAQHLVREMNKDSCNINIGFMKYSSAAMVQVYLGMHTDTETNIRALDAISYSRGRANMAAAFRALRTQMFNGRGGDRPNARNIAYFLTDGTNDVNADTAEIEADLAISAGTRIIPIGINLRNRVEVDNIAGTQGIHVIEIDDEPGLIENTDAILNPIYAGNDFCAESPCRNGGSCRNEPFGYKCECAVGFTGDTCGKRCTAKGNVVFAVDSSRYMTRTEMKRVRRFLISVVKRMRFRRKEFSVGMVQFADWAKVSLTFDQGTSKKAVRSAISRLRVRGGDPQPANAIAKANYRIFSRNANRRDKPEYLILVTKSMRKELDVLHEANKLKVQGTKILGIGLGLTANEQDYMQSAVSLPASNSTWFANDVTDLDDVADKVVGYMCDDKNMCAENPCQNGGSCVRRGGDFLCECSVGYAGRYCQNRCNARADVVFLLDSSGSIGLDDFRRVKQFVHNMVSELVIGSKNTRVGLATYSSQSRHGFYLNKYYDSLDLQNAIAGIQYEYGNTNTADGLRLLREYYFNGQNGDRRNIQDFVVVITDGESNVMPDQTIIEAELLKQKGVHVYAVGIGNFDPYEINSVASAPASINAYMLSDYKSLSNISSSIIKRTCRDPTVCDENPCRNGGVCVPGINGAFCECRAGYRGSNCEQSCVTRKDIFFVLDSSDSVGPENFEKALNFVSMITEEFSSKDSYNRFSLLTYSTDVQIVFSLGRYTTLPIIQNAIRYTRYRPGNTNTAAALRTVQEISVEPLGDRRDAENIIFVLADGDSNVREEDTLPAAEALKNDGARIMSVGVNMVNHDELGAIASKQKDLFKVNSYSELDTIVEDVIKATCTNDVE